jgi:TolA-binding protein
MFDADRNPELAMASGFQPAEVKADEAGQTFEIAFAPDTRARALRLHLLDFETDAPAIRRISLQSADGQPILPTTADIVTLKKNQVLEIVPGDRIQIAYEDPRFISKNKQVLEASLTATYRNAQLSACFVESYIDERGNRQPRYVPMRRFRPGDTVSVFISDPDGDVTDEPDKLKFSAQISGGQPAELEALESEPHSGIFIGRVFPVSGAPQRPSEITVGASDDLLLSYLDQENTDPGIPWNRVYAVEQTSESMPELRIYDMLSRPLTEDEAKQVALRDASKRFEEFVPVTRALIHTRPPEPVREEPATALLGTPLVVELTFPTIAQSPESKATIFVQTLSGAKKYGQPMEGAFDLNVPGTIRLERLPGDAGRLEPPPGYRDVLVRGNPYAASPLEDGRFVFVVPVRLEAVPEKSRAFDKEEEQTNTRQLNYEDPNRALIELVAPYVDRDGQLRWGNYRASLPYLAVRGDDEVFVGVRYTDAAGATNWVTQRAVLKSDVFFDVMDRRYLQPLQAAHVGETLHLRVIEPGRDLSDEKDTLDVVLTTAAGPARTVPLMETFGHSGVFKGSMQLAFAGDPGFTNNAAVLPVLYGDSVQLEYLSGSATQTLERLVQVYKGADGSVLPFTKRFKDPEIAVQTQFTVAEAYFELAKKHRQLGQEPLARKEIEQGKKLLEEAIRDYPRTEVRAQADYLLADLSLEFANDAVNEDIKKKHYMEAIIRFTDIVATKPDSPYAPKSQFKKALTYEKMGQIDQACEEYVKLSYRYPDNELVAETIARLGQYFLTKGKALQEKASAEVNIVEQEKIKIQARDMYKTAAQVFGRLSQRFPDHALSGKTLVLSAQCYMRAEDLEKAIAVFKQVVDDKKADSDLIAQAMYWSADCYMKQRDYKNAYRMFKRVTWDYPESTWAKYARGRLTEPELAKVEQDDQM